MSDRRRWSARGQEPVWCGSACRKRGLRTDDHRLEDLILEQLGKRAAGASHCPSEVARAFTPEHWRDWMEPVRCAGRRLWVDERLEWTQRGQRVDPSRARGPIRFSLEGS